MERVVHRRPNKIIMKKISNVRDLNSSERSYLWVYLKNNTIDEVTEESINDIFDKRKRRKPRRFLNVYDKEILNNLPPKTIRKMRKMMEKDPEIYFDEEMMNNVIDPKVKRKRFLNYKLSDEVDEYLANNKLPEKEYKRLYAILIRRELTMDDVMKFVTH